MDTLRTPIVVTAVLCPVLAALAVGCAGSGAAGSAGSVAGAASTSAKPRPCDIARPILYVDGAVRADGRSVSRAASSGAGNTWAPGGREQAYVSANARRLILRSAAGFERTLFSVPRQFLIVYRPAWSPDGKRLALLLLDQRGAAGGSLLGSYRPRLVVIDAGTGKPAADVALSPKVVNMPYLTNPPDTVAFSPDGSKVAVSWDSLAVVDVAAGSVSQVWPAPAVATWAPAGRLLFLDVVGRARFGALRAWSASGGTHVLWPAAALASRGIAVRRGVEYGQLRVSPDGSLLAVRTAAGGGTAIDLYRMGADGPGAKLRRYAMAAQIWDMDWSPDGRCLAAVVLDGSTLTVRTLNRDTGAWKTVATIDITIDSPDTLDALAPVKKLSWSD